MDVGKEYLVVYKDDRGVTRTKVLKFVKADSFLYHFYNPWKNLEEGIKRDNVFRYEEAVSK